MDNPNLDDLASRPRRYWTIDGLPELTLGVLWVVWGAVWLVGTRLPQDWRAGVYWLIAAPALALMVFGVGWLTRRLKERITFPRTGYVEWKKPARRVSFAVGLTIGTAAAAFAAINMAFTSADVRLERTVPAAITVCLAFAFVSISVRLRTPYHLALAAATIVLSLAIGTVTVGWDAMNWLFIGLGAMCLLVGGVRLSRFLRAHPLPSEGL